MKQYMLWVLAGIMVAVALVAPTTASADVNNFSFSSFEGDYYLSKDDEGRSRLKVVETFTAEFPDYDQNRGVVRAIPSIYDGHSVSVEVESLTRNGATEPIYSQEKSSNNLIISTGDDSYVRGSQTYVLTYTLRDVIKDFGEHQELYWDTIGTQSTQPFGSVVARVHIEPSAQGLFTGKITCYEGAQNSSKQCGSMRIDDERTLATFSSTGQLGAYQNLTFVMEFQKDAFTPYVVDPTTQLVKLLAVGVACLAVLISLMSLVYAIVVRYTRGRDAPGRGIIVPQYLPPADVPMRVAANVIKESKKVIPAQIISLAVRHKITVIEKEKKGLFGKSDSQYTITLKSLDALEGDESELIKVFFGSSPSVGSSYIFKSSDTTIGQKVQYFQAKAVTLALDGGYRRKLAGITAPIVWACVAVLIAWLASSVAVATSADSSVLDAWSAVAVVTSFITIVGAIMTLSLLTYVRPLTGKGRELHDYLAGLELYISVAEQERLKILQSPSGAQKTPVDTADSAQMVRLYERVLPYAVLFGQEKEWAKQLTVYYDQVHETPGWYSGQAAFNAALFASALSNFSSTTTTFSAPSSSSGSGFGGGGFSGGGGGGGGFGGR